MIDVGYAGVIGADRIMDGESPYGHMPDTSGRACGPADTEGTIRDHIQTNGRCESANGRGDTYGPAGYLAYVPAVLTLGWSGKWDSLPAAHATAIAFDLLVVLGLLLVGRRFGGTPLAVALAFGWMAFPFTAYAMNANSNDAIMPAFLVWGFWLASSPVARGASLALAGWTKFAALLLAPLWLTYPNGLRPRTAARFAIGFVVASLAVFSILLLEPSLTEAVRSFVDRTVGYQLDRNSPFSPWDWGQYHASGIPDLHLVQLILQLAVVALAGVVACDPAPQGPARARSVERCRAHRLRVDPDALVVPLHPLVPALRPARADAARAGSPRLRVSPRPSRPTWGRRHSRSRCEHACLARRPDRGRSGNRRWSRHRPRGESGHQRHPRLPDLWRADRERGRSLP